MNSTSPANHSAARQSSSSTSSSLLERAKRRDEQAWQRLVELYGPLVYRMCRRSNVAVDDAVDVAQEVFRAVARNIDGFRRDRPGDSFRSWLSTITINKIRDHFRKLARQVPAVGGTDMQAKMQQIPDLLDCDISNDRDFDSDSSLVHRAVEFVRNEFEHHTWQAFWTTVVEGMSPVDVAIRLGVSKWAVYKAKARVMRRLRQELEGIMD